MYNLYPLCAKFGFDMIWEYCVEHLAFTLILLGCVALALAAIVLLVLQKRKLTKKRQQAEEAAIFLQTMEKEQRAREEAEAKRREQDEAEKLAKAEKQKKLQEQELSAAVTPKKVCLFCGKENLAHAEFCEECAGKKFGTIEDFEQKKAKRATERAEKQSGKKKAEPVVLDAAEKQEEKKNAAPVGLEKQPKYAGKWTLFHLYTGDMDSAEQAEEAYFFELRASNGEKLFASEEYTSYNGARKGIETYKSNIEKNNFKIAMTKKGDYIFKIMSGKNTLLCNGENYGTKVRCESAMKSTKRFARTAIIDENVQDLVIPVPAEAEVETEVAPLPEGAQGKWLISSRDVEDEKVYFFELFANNGEKLLSSEDYTTYIGAVNGIQTHKQNIAKGNFRISLTKNGDYIYKLLNGNNQLLCLGEHYKTKARCESAVESVKRFAASSPTLTDSEHVEA